MMMRYEYDDIVKVVSHKRVIKNMTMKYEDDDDDDNDDDDNDADDDDNDDDDDAWQWRNRLHVRGQLGRWR